jgi:hypothetical protein
VAISWVRVRTLGEFVFCPRAGLLSHASEDEEDEPTDERMNLNFLPEYSLTLIEEQLAFHLRQLWRWVIWTAGGLFLIAVGSTNGLPTVVPLALAVPTFLAARVMLRELAAVNTLNDRRREALAATPTEPPSDLQDDLRVRWWELLKAGFESVTYLEPLRDEELALVGKPCECSKRDRSESPSSASPATITTPEDIGCMTSTECGSLRMPSCWRCARGDKRPTRWCCSAGAMKGWRSPSHR